MANEEYLARLKQGLVNVLATMRYALASGAACVYVEVRTLIAERQVGEDIRQTGQRVVARLRSTPWQELARRYQWLLVAFGALLLLLATWKLPQWYAASWDKLTDPKDRASLESDTRSTIVQAVGGLALLAGLLFTWRNLRMTEQNSRQTLDLSRKGQINDRFIKAIEQLGAVDQEGRKKLEVRLGGIYALEQIAKDSPDDHHWPIMEILTAYVRENASWKEDIVPSEPQPTQGWLLPPKLATDVQAILTVLGRRTHTYREREDQRLNLGNTNLRGADLRDTHLEWANLRLTHLEWAYLRGAHLEQAALRGADLQGAHLEQAALRGTDLQGAQLKGAIGLTVTQLSTVKTLYLARLDPHLREQIEQQYPQLLKEFRE
jgi:hypothetical protein